MASLIYYYAVIFVFSLWIMSGMTSEGKNEYSLTGNTSWNSAHIYSSHFNINAMLQRQTREVVMMNHLPRIDPIQVGYKRNIQIFPGKVHQMKTLGMNPPIFEVENFLTDEECQLIVDLANASGLTQSTTVRTKKGTRLPRQKILELFHGKDVNFDGLLDRYEIGEFFVSVQSLYLGEEDVKKMLNELNLDTNGDEMLSDEELLSATEAENYNKLYEYLENLEKINPERKIRHSQTVFLSPSSSSKFFENLRHRVVNATGLPYAMVKASEDLQVVKYKPSGHYHSHLDSESIDRGSRDCCQYKNWAYGCTLCRYMTVLYFLNDVEEGGETAFPIADNATVDYKVLFGKERHRLDLGRHCHDANFYYKPKKKSALIWYNHKLDEQSGWLGDLDVRSFHGGCNVIKGSKWIANNWIDASPDYNKDIDAWVSSLFEKKP